MRRWLAFGVVAVAGCGVPPNVSPVSFGVPDGMVLGRDVLSTTPDMRAEIVTFAVGDRRVTAYVVTPIGRRKLPAKIRLARNPAPWPTQIDVPPEVAATVVQPLDPLPVEAAARAMMASLEEVDPTRITVVSK
ncbi:MAG: hypothetical protein ACO1SV_10685 [Fimbriimonas sp.]